MAGLISSSVFRQLCFTTLVTFQNVREVSSDSGSTPNLIPWAHPCKLPVEGETLRIDESCEDSKGIVCKEFPDYQTSCDCSENRMSYDRDSQECRIKPLGLCQYFNRTDNPELYDKLSFKYKCHINSECIRMGSEISSESDGKLGTCQCKEGYQFSPDGYDCSNPNGGLGRGAFGFMVLILPAFSKVLMHI